VPSSSPSSPSDGNEGLESGSLTGRGLLLDGLDSHDLVLEGGEEEVPSRSKPLPVNEPDSRPSLPSVTSTGEPMTRDLKRTVQLIFRHVGLGSRDLGGDGVRLSDVGTPVSSSDGDDGELGDDDGTSDAVPSCADLSLLVSLPQR
jgi:hypothetical protein